MENGTEGDESVSTNRSEEQCASTVVKTKTESSETTEVEVRTKTVVVESGSSHITTTTLSTEPAIFSSGETLTIADASSERVVKAAQGVSETSTLKFSSTHQESASATSTVSTSVIVGTDEVLCAAPVSIEEELPSKAKPKEEEPLAESLQQPPEVEETRPEPVEDPGTTSIDQQPALETSVEQPPAPEASVDHSPAPETSVDQKPALEEPVDQNPASSTPSTEAETNVEEIKSVAQETARDVEAVPQPKKTEEGSSSAKIQEQNIKNQLHEIINEIDNEVGRNEEDSLHHTWQPKGQYELQVTEIQYEDIVPCELPDVKLTEKKKEALSGLGDAANSMDTNRHDLPIDSQKIFRHAVMNGEPISPLDIPLGIPLLAKILPRDESGDEESREKIPLERLFTPATDTEEILPQNKKKAYASSCFYRPDHPTIDDQVELAHKISVSLVDENNKTSKGQTMYMKRKNRSSKWIHQGEELEFSEAHFQLEDEEAQEEKKPSGDKSKLKLVLNPKGIQDFNAVQKHYEELMSSSTASTHHITRMEVGKGIADNLESPTGKGAALFAKRKKRMDKFIVDETTVQQQMSTSVHEEMMSSSTSVQDTFSSASLLSTQSSTQMNNGSSFDFALTPKIEGGAIYTAEVKLVQKPSLPTTPLFEMPASAPLYSLVDQLASAKEEEKRKSFNLAPKGWGTYTNYYTPIHLGAQ